MGQEWAGSSPFQYFTDHEPRLGHLVTEGRREEFRGFAAFRDPTAREKIPDPQREEACLQSKLRWDEIGKGRHAATLRLYCEFLQLRRQSAVLQESVAGQISKFSNQSAGSSGFCLEGQNRSNILILADLAGGHRAPKLDRTRVWQPLLSSNEKRFGGEDSMPFSEPEVRVFRAV